MSRSTPGSDFCGLLNLDIVHNEFDVEQTSEQRQVLLEAPDAALFESWVLKGEVICIPHGLEPLLKQSDT